MARWRRLTPVDSHDRWKSEMLLSSLSPAMESRVCMLAERLEMHYGDGEAPELSAGHKYPQQPTYIGNALQNY